MTPTRRIGVAALTTALAAVVIGVVAAPIELVLQLRGGAVLSSTVLVVSIAIALVAVAGLVLGIVGVRRTGATPTPAVAIGVAGFVLLGQVGGLVLVVLVFLLNR